MDNANVSGVIAELAKLEDVNTSPVIAELAKLHNTVWENGIKRISVELSFDREKDFHSKFHQLEDSFIFRSYDQDTGRLSKITFVRKTRETTEKEWEVTKMEIVPNKTWNGRFSFKTFWEGKEQMYSHDYMDETTFFGSSMSKLKKFFFVEE